MHLKDKLCYAILFWSIAFVIPTNNMGQIFLVAITIIITLSLCFYVKSLQFFSYLRVTDLQMGCSDLTMIIWYQDSTLSNGKQATCPIGMRPDLSPQTGISRLPNIYTGNNLALYIHTGRLFLSIANNVSKWAEPKVYFGMIFR